MILKSVPKRYWSGLNQFLSSCVPFEPSWGEHEANISDDDFVNLLFYNYILPKFELRSRTWKIRIIEGIEFGEGLPNDMMQGIWDNFHPDFDLDEDVWPGFFRDIRLRLQKIYGEEIGK